MALTSEQWQDRITDLEIAYIHETHVCIRSTLMAQLHQARKMYAKAQRYEYNRLSWW